MNKQNVPTKVLAWERDNNGKMHYCIAIRKEQNVTVNVGRVSFTIPIEEFTCEGFIVLN